ncbi:MAG: lipocalin family protein [Weeksellaceae bacterium]
MKNYLLSLLCLLLFVNCSDDDDANKDTNLVGTWKITEAYVDPGDQSGKFQPVDSDKEVTFHKNGTIQSNKSLCEVILLDQNNLPTTGTYDLNSKTYTTIECGSTEISYSFEIKENELIIHYNCIEGCSEKYIKK